MIIDLLKKKKKDNWDHLYVVFFFFVEFHCVGIGSELCIVRYSQSSDLDSDAKQKQKKCDQDIPD